MNRRLLNTLAALSLLLCAAAVVLWVRGYRVAEQAGVRRSDASRRVRTEWSVLNSGGGLRLLYHRNVVREQFVYDFFEARRPWRGAYLSAGPPAPMRIWPGPGEGRFYATGLGFGVEVRKLDPPDYSDHMYSVIVPWWFLVLATALLPARWAVRFGREVLRRRRENARGRCRHCGYDLRATPTQCPECGAAVSVAPT